MWLGIGGCGEVWEDVWCGMGGLVRYRRMCGEVLKDMVRYGMMW